MEINVEVDNFLWPTNDIINIKMILEGGKKRFPNPIPKGDLSIRLLIFCHCCVGLHCGLLWEHVFVSPVVDNSAVNKEAKSSTAPLVSRVYTY